MLTLLSFSKNAKLSKVQRTHTCHCATDDIDLTTKQQRGRKHLAHTQRQTLTTAYRPPQSVPAYIPFLSLWWACPCPTNGTSNPVPPGTARTDRICGPSKLFLHPSQASSQPRTTPVLPRTVSSKPSPCALLAEHLRDRHRLRGVQLAHHVRETTVHTASILVRCHRGEDGLMTLSKCGFSNCHRCPTRSRSPAKTTSALSWWA